MWRYLAKFAISAALVYLLLRNRDVSALLREIATVDPLALAAAAAGLFLLLAPQTLRWSTILDAIGHPTSWRVVLPLTLIGLFFSQTLPTSIGGDGMRVWELHRRGVDMSAAVSSVLIDRALGLLGICTLVSLTAPILFGLVSDPAVTGGVVLMLAVGYSGIAVATLFDRLPERLRRLPVVRGFASLSQRLRTVLLTPRSLIGALGASLVYQLGIAAVVFILACGIGVRVAPEACLVLVPIANLSALLPISISGWGVREGAFAVAFGLVGIAASDAIAISVLFGLLNMLVGLTGGVVLLAYRRPRGTEAGATAASGAGAAGGERSV